MAISCMQIASSFSMPPGVLVKSDTLLTGSNLNKMIWVAVSICVKISFTSSLSNKYCLSFNPTFQVVVHIFPFPDDIYMLFEFFSISCLIFAGINRSGDSSSTTISMSPGSSFVFLAIEPKRPMLLIWYLSWIVFLNLNHSLVNMIYYNADYHFLDSFLENFPKDRIRNGEIFLR